MVPLESSVSDATIWSVTLGNEYMTLAESKAKAMPDLKYRHHL